jgi:hypothetical protein
MATKITQPGTFGSFTGKRYGSFAGKEVVAVPDFMHGTLKSEPHLQGAVAVFPHLKGTVAVFPHLNGQVRVNP